MSQLSIVILIYSIFKNMSCIECSSLVYIVGTVLGLGPIIILKSIRTQGQKHPQDNVNLAKSLTCDIMTKLNN